jgi:hypothetical protein
MSLASFTIAGANGQEAQVSITPLGMLGGRDAMIVNMWRQQLGLEMSSPEEATQQLQPVEVGGEKGSLFDLTGPGQEGSKPVRIVTAMVHRPDASWFYKLSGDAPLVEAQKPVFLEFLKTVQIKETAATSAPPSAAEEPAPFKGEVPSGWTRLPAGQMQVAKFGLPEKDGGKGEVFVSVFPNDTGGRLANVNRWRRQVGLPEVSEADLGSMVRPLDPAIPEAMLVELTNKNKTLIGAIIPRGGSYWFYKALGDTQAVLAQKDAFIAFAKSKP